jgi:hypothetical protein
VHDCIDVIHDWIAGKPADLNAAAEAAARAAWAAEAAAEAAWAAAARAAEEAAEAAEKETQRQDLIAAFPPLILKD